MNILFKQKSENYSDRKDKNTRLSHDVIKVLSLKQHSSLTWRTKMIRNRKIMSGKQHHFRRRILTIPFRERPRLLIWWRQQLPSVILDIFLLETKKN